MAEFHRPVEPRACRPGRSSAVCLAIPGRILSIEGEGLSRAGQVDFAGVRKRVSLACLPKAAAGNWVMVHAGMAITVVDEKEAAGGKYVKLADTIRSFKEILDGRHDDKSEGDFYMKGSIEDVVPSK